MHTDNIFFLKNHEVLRLLSNREREIVEMVGQAASNNSIAVFSPFGLGILDLALAKMAYELAKQAGIGTYIDSFLPPAVDN